MIGGVSSCRTRSGVHMFLVPHRGSADPRLFTLEPFGFSGPWLDVSGKWFREGGLNHEMVRGKFENSGAEGADDRRSLKLSHPLRGAYVFRTLPWVSRPTVIHVEPFGFVGHGLLSLENGGFCLADSHGLQDLSRLHISTY
jgi:hypothetical protein